MTTDECRVAIIGDLSADHPLYAATAESLSHAGALLKVQVNHRWVSTSVFDDEDPASQLREIDMIWGAPGSPYRSLAGALNAIRFAREQGIPLLGTCGGFQHVVLEFARHVLDYQDAQHAEYDPYASQLFVSQLGCSLVGKTMDVEIRPGSIASRAYGSTTASEDFYCNFGLNPDYQTELDSGGLRITGRDQTSEARIVELSDHPFYVATLFVPQARSTAASPHPLIVAAIQAALSKAVPPDRA